MKRRAEEQLQPDDVADDEGDLEMGIPLATEGVVSTRQKRGGDPAPEGLPDAHRRRVGLENIVSQEIEFDVGELFSPPWVVVTAAEAGLRGGYSIDKTHKDAVTNREWNLMDKSDQSRLWGLL